MRLLSLPQRALTPSDFDRATRLSKEMALLAKLQGGATTAPARTKLLQGTPEFTAAAKKDYADLLTLHGRPTLTSSFCVKAPPPGVQAAVDAFERLHRGAADVALNTIDGQRTYQLQVSQPQSQAQVLLVDARGAELARGVARGNSITWR